MSITRSFANLITASGPSAVADGTIVNADINASAGIVNSKLSDVGITMADMWRITTNLSTSGDTITANWERADAVQYGTIGTGLTQSSGVFSFPQTGIYIICFDSYFQSSVGTPNYAGVQFRLSYDGGTGFTTANQKYGNSLSSTAHGVIALSYIMDITNISNDKFRFDTDVEDSDTVVFAGSTTEQRTGFTIFRLGDT